MPAKYKYTPEILAEAAANSLSIADVLRHLGITIAGGNYTHISRQLKRFGIDTSHFLPQQREALTATQSSGTGSRHTTGGQPASEPRAAQAHLDRDRDAVSLRGM